MMTDYKYDELINDLKEQQELCEKYLKVAQEEKSKYKPTTETDDKFEVMFYNYWRGVEIEIQKQINFLKETLEKQNEFLEEEIQQMEMAEENERNLRYEAGFGI